MELVLALVAGLILGCIHAFDVDHVAAVTVFSSKNPGGKKAVWFGIVWGLGHTTVLLFLGGLSVALKFLIPPLVQSFAEVTVGLFLVAIGIWVLRDVVKRNKIHIHSHMHDGIAHIHFHSHEHSEHHHHRHSMFLVGATHGLAGTASVMVLVPVTMSQSLGAALLYLATFGIGTMAAMGLFAYAMGTLADAARRRNILPYVRSATGIISLCVGLLWLGEAMLH